MNTNHKRSWFISAGFISSVLLSTALVQAQQTAPPPSLGEETKGAPAIEENTSPAEAATTNTDTSDKAAADQAPRERSGGILGSATIKELRRENGQIYQIELDHSAGPKQYIEETDSDGQIQSKGNDPEDTPNLPKWKLGSW